MIYMDRKTYELYQPSDVYEKANNLKKKRYVKLYTE